MSKSLKHKAVHGSLRLFENCLKAISRDFYFKTMNVLVNGLDLVYEAETPKGNIFFHCNSDTVRIRSKHMLIREPDTIEWIGTFAPDDVFWDIGCNIGVFTLYAAVASKARVVAFDPLPFNYAGLVKNLTLNGLHDRVMAFCVAMSDDRQVSRLRIPVQADTPGGAGSLFGQARDNYDREIAEEYNLAALGVSVDSFLAEFDVPFPNHLKIDIDGLIDPVVAGAKNALRDPRLKSAMIELQPTRIPRNKDSYDFVMAEMAAAGFNHVKAAPGTPNMTNDPEQFVTNNFFVRSGS